MLGETSSRGLSIIFLEDFFVLYPVFLSSHPRTSCEPSRRGLTGIFLEDFFLISSSGFLFFFSSSIHPPIVQNSQRQWNLCRGPRFYYFYFTFFFFPPSSIGWWSRRFSVDFSPLLFFSPAKDVLQHQRQFGELHCVAVCRSALQCVAVCCSVLQCVALCCSVVQCVAARRLLSRESSHVTNDEPCHTYSESCHTLNRVVSRRGNGTNLFDLLQGLFMNESCRTSEWVMSGIWMSHVSRRSP